MTSKVKEPCNCIEKVHQALRCSEIPHQIFKEYQCPCTSKTSKTDFVRCMLYTDDPATMSEDISAWATTYYGTPVEAIKNILLHGELLMAGDVLKDGSRLEKYRSTSDESPAIRTLPKFDSAASRSEVAIFENGKTTFQMVLELRQRPNTFTEETLFGFDFYSTDRRGSVILWAIHVKVLNFDSSNSYGPIPVPRHLTITHDSPFNASCRASMEALIALQSLNIPPEVFDNRYNNCYCSSCRPDLPKFREIAGEKFRTPVEWVKYGIKVNKSFAVMNDIWKSWNTAYHGCAPHKVLSILQHRSLLIPGDTMYNGTKLGINTIPEAEHGFYFLSPTIRYSSHHWYSPATQLQNKYFQIVLLFKIRANSFQKQGETEARTRIVYDDYDGDDENENKVEWYSARRGCTVPYAILVRVRDEESHQKFMEGIQTNSIVQFSKNVEYTDTTLRNINQRRLANGGTSGGTKWASIISEEF